MLELRVNFYASLRKISKSKTVAFQFAEEVTVSDLLQIVIDRFPQMRAKLLDEDNQLHRRAHIFVNGRNCHLLEKGLETQLTVDDNIDIFPIGHF